MTAAAEMRDALLERTLLWYPGDTALPSLLRPYLDTLIAKVEAETRAKACELHEAIIENYADSLRLLNDDYQVEAETRAGLVEAVPTWLREMLQSIHAACSLSLDDPDEWLHALRDIKKWCADALAALPAPAPVTEPVSRTNGKVREHDFCCYYQHEFGQSCLLPDPFVLTVTYGPDTAPAPVTEDALAGALHRAEIDCWPDVDGCAASGHRGAAYRLRAAIPAPEPEPEEPRVPEPEEPLPVPRPPRVLTGYAVYPPRPEEPRVPEHDHFWSPPNPDGRVQCAFCDIYRTPEAR